MDSENEMNVPPRPAEAEDDWRLRRVQITAEEGDAGRRLDILLARRYDHTARQLWQDRIRAGQVRLDGQTVRPGRRVRRGQQIEFVFWQKPEPEINADYRIQYRDDDLIVIEKPSDLPVHPSGIYREHTLYALLKRDLGADFTVHLVHRIDRETSGLLLLAGNTQAAARLQQAFVNNEVRKEYKVIVEGSFPDELVAQGWIGDDPASSVRKKRAFFYDADADAAAGDASLQTARTDFICDQRRDTPAGPLSLLRCRLHTGRTHQIRATLCSLGFPVVGDRLYGLDDRLYLKFINDQETPAEKLKLRIQRTALHSFALGLKHPTTGKEMKFEADLPAELRGLLTAP